MEVAGDGEPGLLHGCRVGAGRCGWVGVRRASIALVWLDECRAVRPVGSRGMVGRRQWRGDGMGGSIETALWVVGAFRK
jgi:hypothetical protein